MSQIVATKWQTVRNHKPNSHQLKYSTFMRDQCSPVVKNCARNCNVDRSNICETCTNQCRPATLQTSQQLKQNEPEQATVHFTDSVTNLTEGDAKHLCHISEPHHRSTSIWVTNYTKTINAQEGNVDWQDLSCTLHFHILMCSRAPKQSRETPVTLSLRREGISVLA